MKLVMVDSQVDGALHWYSTDSQSKTVSNLQGCSHHCFPCNLFVASFLICGRSIKFGVPPNHHILDIFSDKPFIFGVHNLKKTPCQQIDDDPMLSPILRWDNQSILSFVEFHSSLIYNSHLSSIGWPIDELFVLIWPTISYISRKFGLTTFNHRWPLQIITLTIIKHHSLVSHWPRKTIEEATSKQSSQHSLLFVQPVIQSLLN